MNKCVGKIHVTSEYFLFLNEKSFNLLIFRLSFQINLFLCLIKAMVELAYEFFPSTHSNHFTYHINHFVFLSFSAMPFCLSKASLAYSLFNRHEALTDSEKSLSI